MLHLNQDIALTGLRLSVNGDAMAEIRTTQEHPFWSETRHAWIGAGTLQAGELIRTVGGTSVMVVSRSNGYGLEWMYNLTIAWSHTYYVIAGTTPVLVHNEGGGPSSGQVPDMTGMTQTQADELLSRNGFTLTSISEGGYATYKAVDGSKVTIRLSDGRVTRTATVDPGPNQRNWTQRYGPGGQPTTSHDTGENLAC